MSLRSVLMSILALLQDPQPNDPQDGQVAKQLLTSRDEFNRTASYWRLFYATESTTEERLRAHPEYESKLLEFKSHPLVVCKNKCDSELVGVLSSNGWNLERAINCIL